MRRRGAFCLGALLSVLGCGEPGSGRVRRPSLIPSTESAPTRLTTGVTWVFHPAEGAEAKARLQLEDGRVLAVGEGGERWIAKAGEAAHAAAAAAPEALIDLGRWGKGFAFVGASGRVYLADEALGPFVAVRPAPEPFISVSASGGALVGVARDGSVWQSSSWGERWTRAEGIDARVVEVALGKDGSGLAFATPEQWWASADQGRSWRVADLPSVGARRLIRTEDGELVVDGLFGKARYDSTQWTPLTRSASPARSSATELGPVPDASRVRAATAVLDNGSYLGLELGGTGAERQWRVLRGALGSRLTAQKVKGLSASRCPAVVLARRGESVAVLCGSSASAGSVPISLWTSTDGGESFRRRRPVLRGIWGELRLAVNEQGTVLLSGVCPPHLTAAGCAPRGTYRLQEGRTRLDPVPLPGLNQPAALAWLSRDRAVVVGAREKDERLTLYVSSDGAHTFRAQDLGLDQSMGGERRPGTTDVALGADRTGVLSIVLNFGAGAALVTVDSQGHVLSRGQAPSTATAVAAVGLQALAIDPASRSLWESSDGGNSWELASLPRPLCPLESPLASVSSSSCKVAVACSATGCLFGDSLTRLGWGGDVSSFASGTQSPFPEAGPEPTLKTPIACTLGSEPWQLLDGASAAPAASDAAIGRTHWFAVAADYETGAVSAVHAYEGKRALERHELFAPVLEPTRYAMAVLEQVEGSVALRYRVPQSSRNEKEITGIEVAWDNRFEDVVGRARLDEALSPRAGDYHSRAPRTLVAEPNLLSVAGRGVFVRLHAALEDRQTTYYVDGRTVQKIAPMTWPASAERKRVEMVRVGDRLLPLGIHGGGQWIAWADLDPSQANKKEHHLAAHQFGAMALGMSDARAAGLVQSVSFAYTGDTPGFVVIQASPVGSWWRAFAVPLREREHPFAPARPVPLQADLPDPPAPCTESARTTSPRVIAPSFPGNAHPVFITDPAEAPKVLFTERAVLHGTPERPCVAAFDANVRASRTASNLRAFGSASTSNESWQTSPTDSSDERWFAILPAGDLAHAWAFREVSESRWQRRVQARPMSCRYEPGLTIPAELLPSRTP